MPAQETRIAAIVTPAVTLVALVTLWELTVRLFDINPVIFPSPKEIWLAFQQNTAELLMETAITMTEAVLGFLVGGISVYILAIMFVHAKPIQDALYPYAIALKSTPLIAIAPLLVLWFGNGREQSPDARIPLTVTATFCARAGIHIHRRLAYTSLPDINRCNESVAVWSCELLR